MIRIVTARRLRRLEAEAEQARTRAREVQGQADDAWGRHIREVRDLSARAESAESDAAIVREEVFRLEAALKCAAAGTAERGERIRLLVRALEAARRQGRSLVLLLHWGAPHSIHRSLQDVYDYVAGQGFPVHAWGPGDERPAAEVSWRALPFTQDDNVRGFSPVSAPSPEPSGGAA
ncbi:hypothetical protein ACWD4O_21945 [Streptomyces sp. NPDC002623]